MSTIISASIDLAKIDKTTIVEGKNGAKYVNFTVAVNDETNDWGKNVSVYHSQSKEQRDNKEQRQYVGNGKVVWTDGKVVVADRQEEPATANETSSALPF